MKQEKNIILVKTDTSNKLTTLNRDEYINKMNNYIRDMECEEIKKDRIDSVNDKVNDIIKRGTRSLSMKKILKTHKLDVISWIIRRLKDHKSNITLLSIVSKCSGPIYFLEKAIFPFFLQQLLPESRFTNKSTEDFNYKIK